MLGTTFTGSIFHIKVSRQKALHALLSCIKEVGITLTLIFFFVIVSTICTKYTFNDTFIIVCVIRAFNTFWTVKDRLFIWTFNTFRFSNIVNLIFRTRQALFVCDIEIVRQIALNASWLSFKRTVFRAFAFHILFIILFLVSTRLTISPI